MKCCCAYELLALYVGGFLALSVSLAFLNSYCVLCQCYCIIISYYFLCLISVGPIRVGWPLHELRQLDQVVSLDFQLLYYYYYYHCYHIFHPWKLHSMPYWTPHYHHIVVVVLFIVLMMMLLFTVMLVFFLRRWFFTTITALILRLLISDGDSEDDDVTIIILVLILNIWALRRLMLMHL